MSCPFALKTNFNPLFIYKYTFFLNFNFFFKTLISVAKKTCSLREAINNFYLKDYLVHKNIWIFRICYELIDLDWAIAHFYRKHKTYSESFEFNAFLKTSRL